MKAVKISSLLLLAIFFLAVGPGCSTTKQETAKKEAMARWKGVRVAMAL